MKPRGLWQVPILLSFLAWPCAGQRGFQLEPTETIPLEHYLQFWGAHQLQCDSDGNFYMLAHSAEDSSKDYLLRVSANGEEITQIDPRSVPELRGLRISRVFTPGPQGEVFLMASKDVSEGKNPQEEASHQAGGETGRKVEAYVLSFGRGGNLVSTAKLEFPVEPKAIAAFESGELLVSGVLSSFQRDSERVGREPFTGIFNREGLLLKKVDLAGSAKIPPELSNTQDRGAGADPLDATDVSKAGSVDNGSVYLMQQLLQTSVFLLISPDGKVVRKIEVSPPERARLHEVRFADGKLMAMFMRTMQLPGNPKGVLATESEVFRIVNIENGEKTAEYERRRPFIGDLACYTSDMFTFLRVGENRRLELVRAETR